VGWGGSTLIMCVYVLIFLRFNFESEQLEHNSLHYIVFPIADIYWVTGHRTQDLLMVSKH